MGAEFGQFIEWNYTQSHDWAPLGLFTPMLPRVLWETTRRLTGSTESKPYPSGGQTQAGKGFEWIDPNDYEQSVVSLHSKGRIHMTLVVVS